MDQEEYEGENLQEVDPKFQEDGIKFSWAQYVKRKPGLFKIEIYHHVVT
jgi:hypothetical protein